VYTAAAADRAALPDIRVVVRAAEADLLNRHGLRLCPAAVLFIHPDLGSYLEATGASWHQVATASPERCRIDAQRSRVLREHGGLSYSLRHELYHRAQDDGLEHWQAEGQAELFAGAVPGGPLLSGLGPRDLDALLANPPDQETGRLARQTALRWVLDRP